MSTRSVDHDDIVPIINLLQRIGNPSKEQAPRRRVFIGGSKRRLIFIFLQFEVCRYDIQAREISSLNNFLDRLSLVIIAKRLKEGGILVEFRLNSMQRRQRSLRIQIDRKYTVTG